MHSRLLEIVRGMKTSPGASKQSLEELMTRLGHHLPSDYLTLMQITNGAEGPVGSSYVVIWPVDEVVPLNEANAVAQFAPSLVLFGSDGGSKGYGFDTGSDGLPIVAVDLILTDVVEPMGSDLLQFFENIAAAG
jgi:hypothetical protein